MQRIFLASAAIIAAAAVPDDQVVPELTNEEVQVALGEAPLVDPVTVPEPELSTKQQLTQMAQQAELCQADYEVYAETLTLNEKMKLAGQMFGMMKHTKQFKNNALYTAEVRAFKMQPCGKEKGFQKRMCMGMLKRFLPKEGAVNYITMKGLKALDGLCSF